MSGRPYRIAIAPSGNRVAYVPEADGEPRVIDVATGAIAWQQPVGARFDRINLAFLDERTLVITTRCRALRVDLEVEAVAGGFSVARAIGSDLSGNSAPSGPRSENL